jgi:uncharacterized protein YecT (DUF1311 family)
MSGFDRAVALVAACLLGVSSALAQTPAASGAIDATAPVCEHTCLHALNRQMSQLYRAELARTQGTIGERRLIHAQNLWRRYTNADCMFRLGPQRTGGPDWVTQEDSCLAAHVQRRITALQGFDDCRRHGNCPAIGPVWGGGAP